jgi:hypothetical protein
MPHKQLLLRMHEKAPWESRNVYNRDSRYLVVVHQTNIPKWGKKNIKQKEKNSEGRGSSNQGVWTYCSTKDLRFGLVFDLNLKDRVIFGLVYWVYRFFLIAYIPTFIFTFFFEGPSSLLCFTTKHNILISLYSRQLFRTFWIIQIKVNQIILNYQLAWA